MTFTITSTSFVMLFGITFLGWIAGNVGSAIGIIITAITIHTPSLDGQKFWTVAAMLQLITKLQPFKILVAFIVAGVSMYLFPVSPVKATMAVCAFLGCGVSVVVVFVVSAALSLRMRRTLFGGQYDK